MDRCNWVTQSTPKVALDATVGVSEIKWIKWLGGVLTVSGGVTFVDPTTYGTICVRKAELWKDFETNECANARDKKCQRQI